jgi:site-specific DNA recombinase
MTSLSAQATAREGTRAVALIRVSTAGQEHGNGPAEQRTAIGDYAARCGVEVVDWIESIGTSGGADWADRWDLQRAQQLIERGSADLLLVHRWDRLARDVEVSAKIRKAITVVAVAEPFGDDPGGRFGQDVMAAAAALYRRQLLQRSKAGLLARASRGEWPGGPAPFGLRLGASGPEIDPTEHAVVERAVALVLSGRTVYEAAADLNAEGLRPRAGQRWSHRNLRRTLASEHLSGRWTYGDTGLSVELPRQVDELRLSRLRTALAATALAMPDRQRHLLSGGVLLSECGGPMHALAKGTVRARQYRCTYRRSDASLEERCGCRTVDADRIESVVCTVIGEALSRPDALTNLAGAENAAEAAEANARATRALVGATEALGRAGADLIGAGVSGEALAQALAELRRRVGGAQAEVDRTVALIDSRPDSDRLVELAAALEDLDERGWRELLAELGVQVRVVGWTGCETCGGSGRTKGANRKCADCVGYGATPQLRITGSVPAVGCSRSAEAPRHSTWCRP